MSNVSSTTYARIGAILHEFGMVSEEQLHHALAEAAHYATNRWKSMTRLRAP
ncbi:hypothetical protein [Streptomyces chrestomyceticus]|uniref:hypothetical protein n=1 Tax=Streptomyces chrestomyceticus TaxID=68185 RepID=UPI0033CF7544